MIGNNIRGIVGTGLMLASFTVGTIMVKGLSPSAIAMNQAKSTYAVESNPAKYLDAANAYSNAIVDANVSQKPMTPAEKKALYEKLLAAEIANQQTTSTQANGIQLPVAVQTQGTSNTTTPVAKPTTIQIAAITTTKTTTPVTKSTTTSNTQSNTAAQQQAAQQAANNAAANAAAQQAANNAAQQAAQDAANAAAQQAAQQAAANAAAQAAAQAAADAAAQQAAQAAANAAAQQAQIAAQQAAAQQASSGRKTRAS